MYTVSDIFRMLQLLFFCNDFGKYIHVFVILSLLQQPALKLTSSSQIFLKKL